MKWNAFDYIGSSIEWTKHLLIPIEMNYWFKLAFVVFFANLNKSYSNLRLPVSNKNLGSITGNVVFGSYASYSFIGVIFFLVFIISLSIGFISNVFAFVFLQTLIQRKNRVLIKEGFYRNAANGAYLFLFRMIIGFIIFAMIIILFLPYLLAYLGNKEDIIASSSIIYGIPAFFILLFIILIASLINTILTDFVIPQMFARKNGVWQSFKSIILRIMQRKTEVFVYIIAKIGLSMLAGIISFIAVLLLLAVLSPLSFLFAILIFPALKGAGIGIILLLVPIVIFLIFAFLYLIVLLTLPLHVFFRYFSLAVYQKLMSK
jgi:hypothetical protein